MRGVTWRPVWLWSEDEQGATDQHSEARLAL